jgi:hypothetical protein
VEDLTALSPLIQLGFAGFALLQLVVLVWLVREFLTVMRRAIDAIPPLTEQVQQLTNKMEDVQSVGERIRDRLLEWQCPFRGYEPPPKLRDS